MGIDPHVLTLLDVQPHGERIAREVTRASKWAAEVRGHELSIDSAKTWAALLHACVTGDSMAPRIRCARCNVVGTLAEWFWAACVECGLLRAYAAKLPPEQGVRINEIQSRCDDARLASLLDLLDPD